MSGEYGFQGRGWAFPPEFTAAGAGVETVAGADDIRQSLAILLATAPGERVGLEDFGCALERFMFEEIDRSLLSAVHSSISDAIADYETRIVLDDIDVSESADTPGLLIISMQYRVKLTNSRYKLVYPYYLQEASTPAG